MRLTSEQRLSALEREVVILQDSLKVLHNMLKEQKRLINEYITSRIAQDSGNGNGGNSRPEDAMYTFICGKRMQRIENEIKKIRNAVDEVKVGSEVFADN